MLLLHYAQCSVHLGTRFNSTNTWHSKADKIGKHCVQIICGQTVKSVVNLWPKSQYG